MALGRKLEPDLSFKLFCEKKHAPPSDDPGFGRGVDRAREALVIKLQQQAESEQMPMFNPASSCSKQDMYAHVVYQKCGLVTETQFFNLIKKSPKVLGQKPFPGFIKGPKDKQLYYSISLTGLDQKTRDEIKKVKTFWQSAVLHTEDVLRPEDQLTQQQGMSIFSHMTSAYMSNKRPPKMNDPPTLEELLIDARKLDADIAKVFKGDSDEVDREPEEDDEDEDEDEDTEEVLLAQHAAAETELRAQQMLGFSLGSLEDVKKKRGKKGGANAAIIAATAAAASSSKTTKTSTSSPAKPPMAITDDDKSSRRSKLVRKGDEEMAKMDSEMKVVAKAHLSTGAGASVKSLAGLRVDGVYAPNQKSDGRSGVGYSLNGVLGLYYIHYIIIARTKLS